MGAKHFFKGLSWLLTLNLLIKPVWLFVIDRQVQNIVGHQVYGTYFALFNFTYVLLFIADAGLSNMITQRVAANEKINTQQLLRLKLRLLVLYALTCALVALLTGISQWHILVYLVVIQGFSSLFVFLRSLLVARQFFRTDAFFSVFDKFLLLALCVGPVYGLFRPMTIILFLQLQAVSLFAALITLMLLLIKRKVFTAGNVATTKAIAAWVAPFVLIVLLMSAHNRLDAFLLERMHPDGARQAGIYASAYRLLDAGNMLGYLTASFLVPFLSRHRQQREVVQQVLLLCRHGLLFFAAGVVAFVFVFAPWLQQVLYHASGAFSTKVLRLCLTALPAYYLIHVYGSALTATGNFQSFIRILLLAVAVNVLLNLWLIPMQGAVGCCAAALVTQYGCGILLWAASSRKLSVSASVSSAFLYLLTAIVLWGLFYYGQKLTESIWVILSSIVLFVLVLAFTQRNSIKKIVLPLYK